MSGSDQLIQMANDIGNFFRAQPNREDAIAGIANHIKSFWTRRMRDKLTAKLAHGEQGSTSCRARPCDGSPRTRRRSPRSRRRRRG